MKNWFNNLKKSHKLLLIIALYVGAVLFAELYQYTQLFSLGCAACLIFAIIFTVFYVKKKKSNENQTSTQQGVTTTQSLSSDSINNQSAQPEKKPKISTEVFFPKLDGEFVLRWNYHENIAVVQNLDKTNLNDSEIKLGPEPDNQYDPNAVALYKGEYKLGYLYKGRTQEMVLSYLNRNDYLIKTVVCFLDVENNKFAIRIAFYRKLSAFQLDTATVSLTKITKRSPDWGSSRYDNMSMAHVGDCVEISEDDGGNYVVCDEYGNELGEVRRSEKMEEILDDIVYAKIADIQMTNEDNYKVEISIFYR